MRRVLFLIPVLLLSGCVTMFYGNAKVDGGPKQCEEKCKAWDMELVGMVAMGEYTDGCICKKKGTQISMSEVGQVVLFSAAGGNGGTVGVDAQTRNRSSSQNAQSH